MAMKELETNEEIGLMLVGFIDDNAKIHGRKIQGYPVFGGVEALRKVVEKYKVGRIIISFRGQSEEKENEIRKICSEIGAEVEVMKMSLVIS